MYSRKLLFFLSLGLAFLLGRGSSAAEPDTSAADEQTLKKLDLGVDGPALLEYFRKQTLAEADRNKIQALIQKLGDTSFNVREKATTELIDLGAAVVPLLREAMKDTDLEIARRAELCLEKLDKLSKGSVTSAAARLLAKRKPEAAAEVLLAYLPFADDENVAEDVRSALAAVAMRDGKPEKAVIEALKDKLAPRRGAAAEALIRSGAAEQKPAVRKLLQDTDPRVRLLVALALVESKDKDAIPVLIALLADLPRAQGWKAEEVLFQIAGEQAPAVSLGETAAAKKECRDAWAKWWDGAGAKLDLAKLDLGQRLLGQTLIVELDVRKGNVGRVLEIGTDKKPRWQIENLQYPCDAQVLPGSKVLVAEYTGRKVTERNQKGEVLWEKAVPTYPTGCQRLSNGNTFITCRNQLLEVDSKGNEVFSHTVNNFVIIAAQKLRDGGVGYITNNGTFIRLDANGKEAKSFPVGATYAGIGGGGMEVLSNGRILVPQYSANKVVEFDPDGKAVWEATVQRPTYVARLPNGNTLVGSIAVQPSRVVELDRNGKEVWEYTSTEGRFIRVRRR